MENKFKGTKGKWNVSHNSQGYNSFHINSKYKLVHESEEIANAQLISKAPELLEMLKEAYSIIQGLKLSMLVHPDHEEGSEFDDMTSSAQDIEDEIEKLIKEATTI